MIPRRNRLQTEPQLRELFAEMPAAPPEVFDRLRRADVQSAELFHKLDTARSGAINWNRFARVYVTTLSVTNVVLRTTDRVEARDTCNVYVNFVDRQRSLNWSSRN